MKTQFAILVAMMATLLVAQVTATTLEVPAEYPTIQAAVDAASLGDTIQVASGTYSGSGFRDLLIPDEVDNLTISGDEAGETVIDLSFPGRRFAHISPWNSGIEFKFLTFEDANLYTEEGGVLLIQGAGYTQVEGCTFRDCSAEFGGAIYVVEGELAVLSCHFEQCSTNAYGGAIIQDQGYMWVVDSIFSGCSAGALGGAICVFTVLPDDEGHLSVDSSDFLDCSAYQGGAIYLNKGDQGHLHPHLAICDFQDCSAEFGGAICDFGSQNGLVSDCTFSGCTASEIGGAVYASEAIYGAGGPEVNYSRCRFQSCEAPFASALYIHRSSGGRISGSVFYQNAGLHQTMLVEDDYSDLRVTGCLFLASQQNALEVTSSEELIVTSSLFVNNTTALVSVAYSPSIVNCLLVGNYRTFVAGWDIASSTLVGNDIVEVWGDVMNSIVWGNDSISLPDDGVTYSDIQGGHAGEGNFEEDPLFAGFYRLRQDLGGVSPCVNSGNDLAAEVCFESQWDEVCMSDLTTARDGRPDRGVVDLGFHWPRPSDPLWQALALASGAGVNIDAFAVPAAASVK